MEHADSRFVSDTLSMKNFTFTAHSARIIFGEGSKSRLAEEVRLAGLARAVVLTTPNQEELGREIGELLGSSCVALHDGAVMHVPMESVEAAGEVIRSAKADCVVAVGGGSTTGLAKALALVHDLTIIAVPTTYAGSEMTPIYGITESGVKRTGKDLRVLPKLVIYDPKLTEALPINIAITSGFNAIAHAAEGLYAQDINPLMELAAEEGIRAIATALPRLADGDRQQDARSDLLYGAWLCGMVLGNVGMALHHKLCHTLGGTFDLPHAELHTAILPHALSFNAEAAPRAMQRIARAIGTEDAGEGLFELAKRLGAPTSLKQLGMRAEDLDLAADLAVSNPYWNPRPFGPAEKSEIRGLLQDAFDGAKPQAVRHRGVWPSGKA